MFEGKRILILGGTGSWGNCLTDELLNTHSPKEILIYSRNEYMQVMMARRYVDPRVKFIIGDICDYDGLKRACKNIHVIFHLAALKHVPLAEINEDQCVRTNIYGTQNVIKCAIENNVESVIDVSSDKACSPNNLYGMTKAVGEKLILAANKYSTTRFKCVRGGNVLGSNGSVCQLFIDQIRNENRLKITDVKMSRYFLTLTQAINLLITSATCDMSMLVMKMPSCRIIDLATVLAKHFGNEHTSIVFTGIRLGEKLHEILITEHEAKHTYCFGDDFYALSDTPLDLPKVTFDSYSSNSQKYMTEAQIKIMLQNARFL